MNQNKCLFLYIYCELNLTKYNATVLIMLTWNEKNFIWNGFKQLFLKLALTTLNSNLFTNN
jgi:hypothetical protein